MCRNVWSQLPRSKKMVYVCKGAVSHAAVIIDSQRVVQIPYRDNGKGGLIVLSGKLSYRDAQKLDRANKIVWVNLDSARKFSEEVYVL